MKIEIPNLNLRQIAESGQCFRWKEAGADIVCDKDGAHKSDAGDSKYDTYVIPPYGPMHREFAPLVIKCVDEGRNLFELSCNEIDWMSHWSKYLDMDTDYDKVRDKIMLSGDKHAIECYKSGNGIRILKQDTWEMIITFMISQNNNITRITRSVDEICLRHAGDDSLKGKEAIVNGAVIRCPLFPRPEEFNREILKDRTLGLGYRAPYIDNIVKVFAESDDLLNELTGMDYEEARDTLIRFTGIGPKVANCICLFGLHHIEAFPIDTHVKQLLDKYYPKGFPYDKYVGFAGIVQQYLFYYELKNK